MTIQTTAAQELLDQVIATMKDTPDPRLREIATSLVRHLHEFAAEVNLTQAEWMYGMQFLTAVGQYSKPDRNEFILLLFGLFILHTLLLGRWIDAASNFVLAAIILVLAAAHQAVGVDPLVSFWMILLIGIAVAITAMWSVLYRPDIVQPADSR
jgi:hypothetical protein